MQRRLRIINSTVIEPDYETNYVIKYEVDTINNDGNINGRDNHSIPSYVQTCIEWGRETLVFWR